MWHNEKASTPAIQNFSCLAIKHKYGIGRNYRIRKMICPLSTCSLEYKYILAGIYAYPGNGTENKSIRLLWPVFYQFVLRRIFRSISCVRISGVDTIIKENEKEY